MRLTLRTLLAYIDGILDPADHEDLSKQVEASEVASDLIHRTRDTTRRLRLAAPPLEGDPSGFDANAVAEYLDSTASPQAVADFERHCLESDSHLAEAASCHHILTMVLGERAEVDAETRRRMYAIPEVAEAIANAEKPSASASPASATSRIDEVPDYLRGSQKPALVRWSPAIAALLVLGVVAYQAFAPGGWLQPEEPAQVAAGEDPGVAPKFPELPDPGGESPAPLGTNEVAPADITAPSLPEADLASLASPDGVGVSSTVEPTPESLPSDSSNSDITPPAMPGGDVGMRNVGMPGGDAGSVELPSDLTVDPPSPLTGESPMAGLPADATAAAGQGSGTGPTNDNAIDNPAVDSDPALEIPAEPLPVGLLSSTAQVLLRYEETSRSWRRLPVRDAVLAGDRLLSLPTYHPIITMESRLNVELVDGALIQVESDGPTSPLRLRLEYGRLILSNPGGEATIVRLEIGELAGEVSIEGLCSLAIEAARPFVPGADPTETLAPMRAAGYAPKGGVRWSSAAGDVVLEEAGMWRIAGDAVGPAEEMPTEETSVATWIDGRELTSWEDQATGAVQAKLQADEAIWPQLMEVFGSGLKEQAALAAVCSAHVGHFDPFIKALAEPDQRPAWNEEIRTLRAAMSRSSELAAGVRQALVDYHGPERGSDLYRMLCGFSPEQIGADEAAWKNGALSDLLDWLASPHLEYRVLANHNFEEITGRTRIFNPAGTQKSRDQTVNKLRSRLEGGKLTPLKP